MRFLRRLGRPAAQAEPPGPAEPPGSVDDKPFVFGGRIGPSRMGPRRVVNDVYSRNPNGKKWHRIYAVGDPYVGPHQERMARYGRSFLFPCGGAGSEFEPSEDWVFHPMPVVPGVPPIEEMCKSCRASDAKYGKGEIPNNARWDH